MAPADIDARRARSSCWRCRARSGPIPRTGEPIVAGIGRFGPYVRHGKIFKSLRGDDDVLTVGLNRAVSLLAEPQDRPRRGPRRCASSATIPTDGAPINLYQGPLRPLCQP